MVSIKLLKLNNDVTLPSYTTEGSSGADVRCANKDTVYIHAGERMIIPLGFAMEIPKGFEAQIRSRSGLAAKYGIVVLNSPGTIDSDYRGEVKVILINHGNTPFKIQFNDRIAQMVIAKTTQVKFEVSTNITTTKRQSAGFGSTGIN